MKIKYYQLLFYSLLQLFDRHVDLPADGLAIPVSDQLQMQCILRHDQGLLIVRIKLVGVGLIKGVMNIEGNFCLQLNLQPAILIDGRSE